MIEKLANKHNLAIARRSLETSKVSVLLNVDELPKEFRFGGVTFRRMKSGGLIYKPENSGVAVVIETERSELAFGLIAISKSTNEAGDINLMFFDSGRGSDLGDVNNIDKRLALAIKCAQEIAENEDVAVHVYEYLRSSWSTILNSSFKNLMTSVRSKNAGHKKLRLKPVSHEASISIDAIGHGNGSGYYVPDDNVEAFKRDIAAFLTKAEDAYNKILQKHNASKVTI